MAWPDIYIGLGPKPILGLAQYLYGTRPNHYIGPGPFSTLGLAQFLHWVWLDLSSHWTLTHPNCIGGLILVHSQHLHLVNTHIGSDLIWTLGRSNPTIGPCPISTMGLAQSFHWTWQIFTLGLVPSLHQTWLNPYIGPGKISKLGLAQY